MMTPTDACAAVNERFGMSEVTALLQRHGCERLADLWPEQVGDFVEFAQATLMYDEPPSSAWMDGVPMKWRW